MQREKIKGLDGIRAIAALMVVFSHHRVYEALGINRADYPEIFRVLSPTLGVKIFFVLSGFLITFLLIKEHDKYGKVNLIQFYVRRALRLFPLYFTVVIFLFVLTKIESTTMDDRSFRYLFTYTQNYMPKEYAYPSTAHLWSLAVEEHFYLAWPFLFILGRRIALGFAVLFIGAVLLFGDGLPSSWTFPAAIGIAVGCVLAFTIRTRWVQTACTHKVLRYAIFGLSILGLLSPWDAYKDYFYLPAVAALIAFIFFNQTSVATRLLEFKPLALIGVMSYGLYVWHGVLGGTGPYRTARMDFPPEMYTGLALTCLIVPMSYYGFEKPFLQIKNKFRPQEKKLDADGLPGERLNPLNTSD